MTTGAYGSAPYGDLVYGGAALQSSTPPAPPPAPLSLPRLLGSGSFNGLTWGPGTDFHISSIKGFDDIPTVRTSDAPRAADIGRWRGQDLLDERVVQLGIAIIARDSPTFFQDVITAENAFQPFQMTELPLLLFNSSRQVNCRCRKRTLDYDATYTQRQGMMQVQFEASDPRIYDATGMMITLSPAVSVNGASWPWSWPVNWGGPSSAGIAMATNAGNWATRPVITITGPCTNPAISNQTLGRVLSFALTLAAADQLVIDTDARSVVLNGTASRRASLISGSQWWQLPPGSSTLAFAAASSSAGCKAVVNFHSAWV